MPSLKLQALDEQDLTVLSAQCQDAVLHTTDFSYQQALCRFAFVCNRFDWQAAGNGTARDDLVRRRAAVRFERVTRARFTGFDRAAGDGVLALLAIEFEPSETPAGSIRLKFAAGAEVRLDVECIEAELNDLGAAWTTAAKPDHSAS